MLCKGEDRYKQERPRHLSLRHELTSPSFLQIQTIAFLSHLYQRSIYGPFMIVAPLSTLSNWVNEFERFCPSLKTVLYHGSKKERSEIRSKKLDVGENPEFS